VFDVFYTQVRKYFIASLLMNMTQANSAFHPYGVDKSSTNLPGWGEGGAVTSVGRQITL